MYLPFSLGGQMINNEYECKVEKTLLKNGYEGVMFLTDYSYDDALVGVSTDKRAVYNYDAMVEWLVEEEGFEDDIEAMEWIDYNTIRAIPYFGSTAPVIYYPKDYEGQSALEYLEDHCFDDEVCLLSTLDDCFLGISMDDAPVYDFALAEKMIPGISCRDYSAMDNPPVFLVKL